MDYSFVYVCVCVLLSPNALWLLIRKHCPHHWPHFWVHLLWIKCGVLIPWTLFHLLSVTQSKMSQCVKRFTVDFAWPCPRPRCHCTCASPKISAITDLSACAPANLRVSPQCRPHNLTPTFYFFFFLGGGVSCPHRACVGLLVIWHPTSCSRKSQQAHWTMLFDQ